MPFEKQFWFHAKRYGWGWGLPARWQGWVVLAAYFALLAGGIVSLLDQAAPLPFIAFVAVISAGLVFVCWLKGEPPKWRWGRD